MLPVGLFPHLDRLHVERVLILQDTVTRLVAAKNQEAPCPGCARRSRRVHSRYHRTLRDLPCADKAVVLRLRVRRFRCTNDACPTAIFAERFPDLGRVRARRTHRQRAALEHLGFALGGAAGNRLARRLKLSGSRSTILRLILSAEIPQSEQPRIVGVDDWAWRKGQRYGTILVDLEKRKAIDLLPDRKAETVAQWLREHPGVTVISRDRGGNYAEGARQGAPNAIQIADRFHLLVNIGEAVERVLSRKLRCLKEAAMALDQLAALSGQETKADNVTPSSSLTTAKPLTKYQQLKEARRERRKERYEAIMALREQGFSPRAIARRLGTSRNTVRRLIRAEGFPERAERAKRWSILNRYEPYLRERWTAGCHNAHTLWQEIRAQGFDGSASRLRQYVAKWRATPGRTGPTPRRVATGVRLPMPPVAQPAKVPSARQARWLLVRKDDELRAEELTFRDQLLQTSEEVRLAKTLADDFSRIVRERDLNALGDWLKTANGGRLPEFHDFARVLRRDLAAVEAALTYEWSNGQTEGQINRLKMLKRQMYGRASLELLRRRFLQAG